MTLVHAPINHPDTFVHPLFTRHLCSPQCLFMPCEGYTELISASMDADLSRLDRFAVRLHATFCKGCRRYRKQVLQLRDMLRHIDENLRNSDAMQLTAEARDRILLALRRDGL